MNVINFLCKGKMMKYLRYVLILIWKLVIKVLGIPMFYVVLPFRKYLRNRVYNYHFDNDIYCRGLSENKVSRVQDGWKIVSSRHYIEQNDKVQDGFVQYNKVSKLEYYFALTFWVFLDDGSNHDTADYRFTKQWAEELPKLHKRDFEKLQTRQYGSPFELGDLRENEFYWITSTRWLFRNTAYNFNYKFEELGAKSPWHFYHRFTTKYFDWHFGYIPYSNSIRKGRMVWFAEDIDRIDQ